MTEPTNHSGTPIEILIVEDSPVEAEMLRRILVRAGYRVTLTKNGKEGLRALREHPCTLVMSDINMPQMNGYELCHAIKLDEKLWGTPVILVTSLAEPKDIIKALDVGADGYITKPYVEDILLGRIRSLLANPATRKLADERRKIQLEYGGEKHSVAVCSPQMANLMLSVYENSLVLNQELMHIQNQLNVLNESLEEKIRERTASLAESETKFRNISESAQDAIIMMGADQCISFWNTAAVRIFGYTAAEAIGQELHALIVPAPDHTKFSQAFPHFQETGEGPIIGKLRELTALRKGGVEFPVELSVSATQFGGQWHAIGIVRDITERKQAEESIRISQAQFGTIFNQAPLGIALIDSFTGQIYEVNPRFAEIAGRTIEEMTTIDWMSITHPDDVQKDLDNMALLNAGKIPGFRMDKRYIHPDGSFVWINMTIAPLRIEKNILPRHLCMIDDITERKRVELKLAEQLDELRRWQEVMLGREMRTIEVMREVNELLAQAGQPPRYQSAEQVNAAAEGSLRSSGAAPRPTEGRVSGCVPFTGEPTGVPLAGE